MTAMSRKLVLVILSRLVTISLGAPTAGTEAYTGALADTGCFAPKAAGGWGFCGPLSCKDTYVTCPGTANTYMVVLSDTEHTLSSTDAALYSATRRGRRSDYCRFGDRDICDIARHEKIGE